MSYELTIFFKFYLLLLKKLGSLPQPLPAQSIKNLFCNLFFEKKKKNLQHTIRHLHISHKTPCLRPKTLHDPFFFIYLGYYSGPETREIKDNVYAKFWGEHKVNNGRCKTTANKYILKWVKFSAIIRVIFHGQIFHGQIFHGHKQH